MAVVGTWTGVEARSLRHAGRMTVQAFAERLGVAVRTVAYWESRGASITPTPDMQLALDTFLAAADPDTQARFHLLIDALQPPADIPVRQGKGAAGPVSDNGPNDVLAAVLRHGASADLVAVAHLQERVHELDERYDRSPSTWLLAEAGERLGQVAILRSQTTTTRVHRALCAVEAEAATLMGQLVWDASQRRDHSTARAYFAQAVRGAQQIGNRAAEALAVLRTSYVALYGEKDPDAGLELANRAAEAARGSSSLTAALATLHVAEAHAMRGQARACERALDLAASLSDRPNAADPASDVISPLPHGRLAGSCYLFLGRTKQAVPILEDTVDRLRDGSKSQAIALANLALAHVRQRELDEGIACLHRAIDVVEVTRGGGGLNIVLQVGRELGPWRRSPAAQEVYDRLLALTARAGSPMP